MRYCGDFLARLVTGQNQQVLHRPLDRGLCHVELDDDEFTLHSSAQWDLEMDEICRA